MASTAPSSLFFLSSLLIILLPSRAASNLFVEYIGALFTGVKFTDVPINPSINHFQFVLAFAIDYTANYTPTNGHFNVFWDSNNLGPSQVAAIKGSHSNVKVALSLGGDSVGGNPAKFQPSSIDSWVRNAVSTLTTIIRQYNLDGIDIDYEHFSADPNTFAECIGRLITTLKNNGVITFASIAPFPGVEHHYLALWNRYKNVINHINFQFYAYGSSTTVPQFLSYYDDASAKYGGGNLLVSFSSESGGGGLVPGHGFFNACKTLKSQGKLHGIFVWAADTSKNNGFRWDSEAQTLIVS